ncbi:hypothetical protein JCM18899A_08260 [Nocardioides sp. AN3]
MALSDPLRAAGPAMDQWAIHIGAMNKLVVGAISLAQATQFWEQTRVGAKHRIARFQRARAAMQHSGLDCPAPALVGASTDPAVRACSRLVLADLRAVQTAGTAIDTWGMHVKEMERLRAGTLSAAVAGQMWLRMWHRGQQQLDSYRAAVRTARHITGCTPDPRATSSQGSAASSPAVGPTSPSMDMGNMG